MPAVAGPWEMLRISAGEMLLERGAQLQAHDSNFVSALTSVLSMASLADSAVDHERAVTFIYKSAIALPSMPVYICNSGSWIWRVPAPSLNCYMTMDKLHGSMSADLLI